MWVTNYFWHEVQKQQERFQRRPVLLVDTEEQHVDVCLWNKYIERDDKVIENQSFSQFAFSVVPAQQFLDVPVPAHVFLELVHVMALFVGVMFRSVQHEIRIRQYHNKRLDLRVGIECVVRITCRARLRLGVCEVGRITGSESGGT